MPLYEYKCECGQSVEVLRSFALAPKSMKCSCGKELKRQFPRASFKVWGNAFNGDESRKRCGVEM